MEAKDTVMSPEEVETKMKAGYHTCKEGIGAQVEAGWLSIAQAQAEITWPIAKCEGIREVVEWIRKGCACFQPDEKGEYVILGWQAKLKEWGIE